MKTARDRATPTGTTAIEKSRSLTGCIWAPFSRRLSPHTTAHCTPGLSAQAGSAAPAMRPRLADEAPRRRSLPWPRAHLGAGGARAAVLPAAHAPACRLPRPPRCLASQLGRLALVAVSARLGRITHFQAEWCRDGRERAEKLRQRRGTGKRRWQPSVRGFWTTGNSIPASESGFEHHLTSRSLTHVPRSSGSRRTAAPGQPQT